MKKFAVFSGFLGAGKTSAMLALTKYYTEHIAPAAMISNDLGQGVTLADHRFAALSGARSGEITGECICFCHDVLAQRLDAAFDDGCELVLSDIPGFGVGALEHVYHGLSAEMPGRWALGPFTVLIEPRSVDALRAGGGDMGAILRAQLAEADLVVLNKRDLLTDAQVEADLAFLRALCPEAEALAVSARTGAGLDALAAALREGSASLRHPAIDYDDALLQREMDSLSEYYLQYRAVVCCDDFDGTDYLAALALAVRADFAAALCEIPHLKLLAWEPEGDFGKVDLLGVGREVERTRPFERRCTDIAVVLNASAAAPPATLDEIVTGAAQRVSKEYNLEMQVFKKDCFGMGE